MKTFMCTVVFGMVISLAGRPCPAARPLSVRRVRVLITRVAANDGRRTYEARRELSAEKLSPEAIGVLAEMLAEEGQEMRRAVMGILARQGLAAKPAVPHIVRILRTDDDEYLRSSAAYTLGAISSGDGESVDALIEAATTRPKYGQNRGVPRRRQAIEALLAIGPAAKGASGALAQIVCEKGYGNESAMERVRAMTALARMGPASDEVIAPLLALYRDPERIRFLDRWRLAVVLCKIGAAEKVLDDVIKAAATQAKEPERDRVRTAALEALGEIGPIRKDVVPTLMMVAKDGDVGVRSYAIRALGAMGPTYAEVARSVIMAALKNRENSLVLAALDAMIALRLSSGPLAGEVARFLDGDGLARLQARKTLATMGTFGAEVLAARLGDRNASIRGSAAEGLGEIGPAARSAVGALTKSLTDSDTYVRAHSARAIGSIAVASDPVVDALARALTDREKYVRTVAAHALGAMGPKAKRAAPALLAAVGDPNSETAYAACEALTRMGPAAKEILPDLIQMAGTNAPSLAQDRFEYVLMTVVRLGGHAVADLTTALKNRDTAIRVFAAKALGRIGPEAKTAGEALMAALDDRSSTVRGNAAMAIADVASDRGGLGKRLVAMLDDKSLFVAWQAANALGTMGPETVELLVAKLRDPKPVARALAAEALGGIGTKPELAVGPLSEAVGDKDLAVRTSAIRALERFGPAARPAAATLLKALAAEDNKMRAGAAAALGRIGQPADQIVAALVSVVSKDKDDSVRVAAIRALGRLGPAALPAHGEILAATAHENRYVGATAKAALRAIGSPNAKSIANLLAGIQSGNRTTADFALERLIEIKPPHLAADALVVALLKGTDSVPGRAGAALRSMGKAAVGPLSKALNEGMYKGVRGGQETLISMLMSIGADKRCVPGMIKAIEDGDWGVALPAATVLGRIGPDARQAAPALIRAMNGSQSFVMRAAATALGQIGPVTPEVIPALIQRARARQYIHEANYEPAIKALVKIGKPAVPHLAKAMKSDKDIRVRYTAGSILVKMGSDAATAAPTLRLLLGDSDKDIREIAAKALEKIEAAKPNK